ncbi:MAG: hypothetical protein HQM16_11480 [Deltaproteobacteria bacterium]|nr:hypothetical protein [Deltaproteobacteria bacterium]
MVTINGKWLGTNEDEALVKDLLKTLPEAEPGLSNGDDNLDAGEAVGLFDINDNHFVDNHEVAVVKAWVRYSGATHSAQRFFDCIALFKKHGIDIPVDHNQPLSVKEIAKEVVDDALHSFLNGNFAAYNEILPAINDIPDNSLSPDELKILWKFTWLRTSKTTDKGAEAFAKALLPKITPGIVCDLNNLTQLPWLPVTTETRQAILNKFEFKSGSVRTVVELLSALVWKEITSEEELKKRIGEIPDGAVNHFETVLYIAELIDSDYPTTLAQLAPKVAKGIVEQDYQVDRLFERNVSSDDYCSDRVIDFFKIKTTKALQHNYTARVSIRRIKRPEGVALIDTIPDGAITDEGVFVGLVESCKDNPGLLKKVLKKAASKNIKDGNHYTRLVELLPKEGGNEFRLSENVSNTDSLSSALYRLRHNPNQQLYVLSRFAGGVGTYNELRSLLDATDNAPAVQGGVLKKFTGTITEIEQLANLLWRVRGSESLQKNLIKVYFKGEFKTGDDYLRVVNHIPKAHIELLNIVFNKIPDGFLQVKDPAHFLYPFDSVLYTLVDQKISQGSWRDYLADPGNVYDLSDVGSFSDTIDTIYNERGRQLVASINKYSPVIFERVEYSSNRYKFNSQIKTLADLERTMAATAGISNEEKTLIRDQWQAIKEKRPVFKAHVSKHINVDAWASLDRDFLIQAREALGPLFSQGLNTVATVIEGLAELCKTGKPDYYAEQTHRYYLPIIGKLSQGQLWRFNRLFEIFRLYPLNQSESQHLFDALTASTHTAKLLQKDDWFDVCTNFILSSQSKNLIGIIGNAVPSLAKGRDISSEEYKGYLEYFEKVEQKLGANADPVFRYTIPAFAPLLSRGQDNLMAFIDAISLKLSQVPDELFRKYFEEFLPALSPLAEQDIEEFYFYFNRFPPGNVSPEQVGLLHMVPLIQRKGRAFALRCMERLKQMWQKDNSTLMAIETMAPLLNKSPHDFFEGTRMLMSFAKKHPSLISVVCDRLMPASKDWINEGLITFGLWLNTLDRLAERFGVEEAAHADDSFFYQVLPAVKHVVFKDIAHLNQATTLLLDWAQSFNASSCNRIFWTWHNALTFSIGAETSLIKDLDDFKYVLNRFKEIAKAAGPDYTHYVFGSNLFNVAMEGAFRTAWRSPDKGLQYFEAITNALLYIAQNYAASLDDMERYGVVSQIKDEFQQTGLTDQLFYKLEIYKTLNVPCRGQHDYSLFNAAHEFSGYIDSLSEDELKALYQRHRGEIFLSLFRKRFKPMLNMVGESLRLPVMHLYNLAQSDDEFRGLFRQELLNSLDGVTDSLSPEPYRLNINEKTAAMRILVTDLKKDLCRPEYNKDGPADHEAYRLAVNLFKMAVDRSGSRDGTAGFIDNADFGENTEPNEIAAFRARLLAELLEPCVLAALAKRGIIVDGEMQSFHYEQKALTVSVESFKSNQNYTTAELFINHYDAILKDGQVSSDKKREIIDLFFVFLDKPEGFKLFFDEAGQKTNERAHTQMTGHILSALIDNVQGNQTLTLEEREKILVRAIEFAEATKTKAMTSQASKEQTLDKVRLYKGLSLELLGLLDKGMSLAQKYGERITDLTIPPKGPDASLLKGDQFVAKIFFQERYKQDLWHRMYINEEHGYKLESFQLQVPDANKDKIAEIERLLKLEASSLHGLSTRHGPLFDMIFNSSGGIDKQGVLNELASFFEDETQLGVMREEDLSLDWANSYPAIKALSDFAQNISGDRGYLHFLKGPTDWHRLVTLFDVLGLLSKSVYARQFDHEGGQKRQVIIIPRAPNSMHLFKGSVFEEDTSDSPYRIDYVVFNGHAGGGTVLEDSFDDATFTTRPMMVQIANCWSHRELSHIYDNIPFAHPIVTKVGAYSNDGALIFGNMMDEIGTHWERAKYQNVRDGIDATKKNRSGICSIGLNGRIIRCGEDAVGNRMFADEDALRLTFDSDGDGINDYKSYQGHLGVLDRDFDFRFETPFENRNDLKFEYTTSSDTPSPNKINDTLGNIDPVFEDDPFLRGFSSVSAQDQIAKIQINTSVTDYYNNRINRGLVKGWYWASQGDQRAVIIGDDYNSDSINVLLNIGYANQSKNALRIMVYKELAEQLAKRYPQLHKESVDKMFKFEDLLEGEKKEREEILKRAKELGLTTPDLAESWKALALKQKSDENACQYIAGLRGILRGFKFLSRYYQKYSAVIERYPDDARAKERLSETKELYDNAVAKYKLPKIDFETAMKIMEISTSPTAWYVAYAIENKYAIKSLVD